VRSRRPPARTAGQRQEAEAARRGLRCRFLVEASTLEEDQRRTLTAYQAAGIEIRLAAALPLKLALFDETEGLIALLDPVISRPNWTAVVFTHAGMAEAMKILFEQHWAHADALTARPEEAAPEKPEGDQFATGMPSGD